MPLARSHPPLTPSAFLETSVQRVCKGKDIGGSQIIETNGPWGLEPQTSTAGTAKVRGSSYKTYFLWVGLWIGKSRRTPEPPHAFPRTFLDSFLNSRHPGANRFGKQRVSRY